MNLKTLDYVAHVVPLFVCLSCVMREKSARKKKIDARLGLVRRPNRNSSIIKIPQTVVKAVNYPMDSAIQISKIALSIICIQTRTKCDCCF